jgi:hypothetical protein
LAYRSSFSSNNIVKNRHSISFLGSNTVYLFSAILTLRNVCKPQRCVYGLLVFNIL